jgi:hypothetical protein
LPDLIIEIALFQVEFLLPDTPVFLVARDRLLEQCVLLLNLVQQKVGLRVHPVDILMRQNHCLHNAAT